MVTLELISLTGRGLTGRHLRERVDVAGIIDEFVSAG
jgi:hypothetical protein